ncbi:hypothetical protein ACH4E8_29530 [Streptomyces sp. NPDC017979]|uniref:hypothetical protein n=1 Tax=Streptomyces sp. NPDC017979 TaxID=3365024 RepID=UPI0037AA9D54
MPGANFDDLGREINHRPRYHRPKFYRYRIADDLPSRPRATWNRYENQFSRTTIGLAVIVGHYAYCVKWASAEIQFL